MRCQEKGHAQDHRANILSGRRLEEVGATTSAVAHVITDKIGDDSGIARIIFRNISLNLTYKISANICRFGIDAAAQLRKECHKACAKTKANDQRGGQLRMV